MTLQEAKDQIAIGIGLTSWRDLMLDDNWNKYGRNACNELAKYYAEQKAREEAILFGEWADMRIEEIKGEYRAVAATGDYAKAAEMQKAASEITWVELYEQYKNSKA